MCVVKIVNVFLWNDILRQLSYDTAVRENSVLPRRSGALFVGLFLQRAAVTRGLSTARVRYVDNLHLFLSQCSVKINLFTGFRCALLLYDPQQQHHVGTTTTKN